MTRKLIPTLLLGLSVWAGPAAGQTDTAVLQGLDKITARISTIETPVDTPVHFGTLEIVVHYCEKRPPEEPPETVAFLDIYELRPNEDAEQVFTGWMFASSPALSALEARRLRRVGGRLQETVEFRRPTAPGENGRGRRATGPASPDRCCAGFRRRRTGRDDW